MSLRFYSPKIRAALTVSSSQSADCDAFILANQEAHCSVPELSQSAQPLIATDLELRKGDGIILVGNPENKNFNSLLKSALKFSSEKNLGLAIRWKLEESQDFTPLSGYGVELRLKSTEYKERLNLTLVNQPS